MEHLKKVFLSFNEKSMQELDSDLRLVEIVTANLPGTETLTGIEKLKLKFDQLCAENGLPIVQSISASALYDVLRWLFLAN